MEDQLTNAQIALLCDIGEYDAQKATDAERREIARLVAAGFVTSGSPPKLTAKGAEYLSARGAGLNEA